MTQTLRYKDITKEESAAKKVIVRMINLFVAKKNIKSYSMMKLLLPKNFDE